MSWCSPQALVVGDERGIQCLRQRNVGCVVRGKIVPERPDSIEQRIVRIAGDREAAEQVDRRVPTRGRDLVLSDVAPKRLGDLDVQKVRCVESLP